MKSTIQAERKKPFLLIISGGPGTGKTTLFRELLKNLNAYGISLDELEKKISAPEKVAEKQKYPLSLSLCALALKKQHNVILEGSFRYSTTRLKTLRIAEKFNTSFYFVHCECSEKIAKTRLSKRNMQFPGYYKKTACFEFYKGHHDPLLESFCCSINTELPFTTYADRLLRIVQ